MQRWKWLQFRGQGSQGLFAGFRPQVSATLSAAWESSAIMLHGALNFLLPLLPNWKDR